MTILPSFRLAGAVWTSDEAAAWAVAWRTAGRSLVFTNGCFDLLHRGHVDYLQRARGLGDALLVGLNSDASVRRLKGAGRPLMAEADRAAVLAALRAVDGVVIFDSLTAEALVAALHPDVYVKGGDWGVAGHLPPEAAVAEQGGGRVQFIPYLSGYSTSALVARARAS